MPEKQARLSVSNARPYEGPAMAHIQDVAAYILRQQRSMTAMKLQKLCYYSYAHHLVWEERQLFPERFEAWANGPVSRDLYRLHRGRLQVKPGDIPGDLRALDRGERESIDYVLEGYGHFSAHQLSRMSHNEEPWILARRRAGAQPMELSTEELSDDEIFEFFDALSSDDVREG
jgi:uncharacterized phage-associated protein